MTLNKAHTQLFIGLLMVLGLAIRLIHFEHTTFAYDQARDAFQAIDILTNDPIKLIGPTTDIPGLFHGALYWYIISPVYTLSGGNPIAVKFLLTLLHLFMIPLAYFLALKLTKNQVVGFISAILMTVSFEAVQYARWLSNPTLANMSVALFYYGLWNVLHKKHTSLGLMLVMVAISIQFQFFFLYLGVFLLAALAKIAYDKKLNTLLSKPVVVGTLGAMLFASPFILSEIAFGFQGTKSFMGFLANHTTTSQGFDIVHVGGKFMNSTFHNAQNTIFGFSRSGAGITLGILTGYLLYSAIYLKKLPLLKLFLLIWFFSPGIIYPLEKNNAYFLNLGNIFPLIIVTALSIVEIAGALPKHMQRYAIAGVLLIIVAGNIQLITQNNIHGETLFSVQDNVDLQYAYELIDWMYQENPEGNFSFNSVTNPLFINTTWAYLFNTYAQNKYSALPMWAGDPIDGRHPGGDVPFRPTQLSAGLSHYVIIEPGPGIPDEYIPAYQKFEDSRSQLIETRMFGNFKVEKRVITEPKGFSRNEVFDLAKTR